MQVQRVFDAYGSSVPSNPSGVPALIVGAYTGVIVNGIDLGSGRILSYGNPVSADITENGRHLWKQTVNMEISSSGDLGNLDNSTAMVGLFQAYSAQLQSLDEGFTFDMSSEGDYQYTHNASARCLNEPSGAGISGYAISQKIASGLLASTPPFGYFDAIHSGLHNTVGKRHYTETIDRFNGTAAFEEKFIIQQRDFAKHSVNFENGFANVSESITLRNSGVTAASDVFGGGDLFGIITRYNTVFSNSQARCNSLWTTYQNVLGLDIFTTTLNAQPSQLTKSFDERNQELTYTVVYTNNPQMTAQRYAIEREQAFTMSAIGITEAIEQGTITSYSFKDDSLQSSLAAAIHIEISNVEDRLAAIWSEVGIMNRFSESRSVSSRGKRATYTQGYTNDPSFINDGVFLTKNIAIQDNDAIRMHSPYFIVGRAHPLMHNPGQTQFGNTSCTISARLPRPIGYTPDVPVQPNALNTMFISAINIVLQTIAIRVPLDVYLSKCSYTYNSDFTVELSVDAQYIYARSTNV